MATAYLLRLDFGGFLLARRSRGDGCVCESPRDGFCGEDTQKWEKRSRPVGREIYVGGWISRKRPR